MCAVMLQVDGELTRRLDKLGSVAQDLTTFQQSADAFESTMDECEREIDEYRKYIATTEDFGAVRNSFQVIQFHRQHMDMVE